MRKRIPFAAVVLLAVGCTTPDIDRTTRAYPRAWNTRITFEPLDREQAQRYLLAEKQSFKVHTAPMVEQRDALMRGREERFTEIRREFPECDRQKHCIAHVSRGDVKKFERYNDLTKEINRYDEQIIEIDTAMRDWESRLDMRSRAIINRFIVHEVLQLPTVEPRLQGVLAYSLESFETRRQLATSLLRYSFDENLEPRMLGDYDYRMLGRPIDEGAVIATFEVLLSTPREDFDQPTRYIVSMLMNTHQLDLRYYDKDFLRPWAREFAEPYQPTLKLAAFCGLYSIAGQSLAARIGGLHPRKCADLRAELRDSNASQFPDRFAPDRWMVPLAYLQMENSR